MFGESQEVQDNQKVSKYNSGVNIQIRLDRLWIDCHNHSRAGLFTKWNSDLDCIWIELAGDVKYKDKKNDELRKTEKDSEYNKFKKEFDEFDNQLIEIGEFMDNLSDGFEKIKPEQIKIRAKQYKILMEKSLFLKRLEKYLGKGTRWDDDDDDDF